MKHTTLALLCSLVCLGGARVALGQTASPPAAKEVEVQRASSWLGDRIGTAPLERALMGGSAQERERALERLGTLGTARALDLLVKALEPSGAAQSPRERLLAARALASHVRDPKVRECLVRVMTGISVSAERSEPLHALLRDSAALALAASAEPLALEALGKALRQPGRVAQAAAAALLAHPPRHLTPLLGPPQTASPELVLVLEGLADERAFETLRDVVRRGTPDLSARAALALTRLGNFETVALARHWSRTQKRPVVLLAAAEILTLARHPDASRLLTTLLKDPKTRSEALPLATAWPDPDVQGALWHALDALDPGQVSEVLVALGRNGGRTALERLARLSRVQGPRAEAAAYALALSPTDEARRLWDALLQEKQIPRNILRAATLRRAALGSAAAGLDAALRARLNSKDPADRAVAAFGLAMGAGDRAGELLLSEDPVIVEAAARAAPFVGAAAQAAARLVRMPPGVTRSQLALALADEQARQRIPTRVLLELLTEGGVAAPLALLALGERDSESTRHRILEHLTSPDSQLRAHVALGLGGSETPSALALLEGAYQYEIDARVRHAIVLGLARRPEAARRRALTLAAKLDSDAPTRNSARLALSGVRPSPFATGIGTLWVTLSGAPGPLRKAARVQLPTGVVLPVLSDPDGTLTLAGLPAGSVTLRLAREGGEGNARAEQW